MANLKFQHNDGGRVKAGYKGTTGDCVPRALCIALGLDYDATYRKLTLEQNSYVRKNPLLTSRRRNSRTVSTSERESGISQGINIGVYGKILTENGWAKVKLQNKLSTRQAVAAYGPDVVIRSITKTSGHLVAVIGGVMQDSSDSWHRKNVSDVWVPASKVAVQPATPSVPVPAAPAPRSVVPVATRVVHGIGPNIGEILGKTLTQDQQLRIVVQRRAGISVKDLAKAWGKSEVRIYRIMQHLG